MSGVDFDGNEIRKGAAESMQAYVTQAGGVYSEECDRIVQDIAKQGGTPLVVAKNHKILGVIHLKDIIKQGVQEKFADLRKMGIKTIMITGDNPMTAAAIAAEAGVDDFLAEATPEGKLSMIRDFQAKGHLVAMTGDGTNDAPALAQADVAFHDVIYQATNNERLIQLLNNLREQMYRYRIEYLKDVKSRRSLVEEHDALYERMKNRDLAGAQKMIREHIERQQESIMQTVHHQSMTGVEE